MNNLNQVVVFKIGDESYGVSISQVNEIEKMLKISKLPNTPDYIKGIVNLRGRIHMIFDLRTKFGLEYKPADENTKIIVMNGQNIGFIVDEVFEIIHVEGSDVDTATDLPVNLVHNYISCIVKKNESIITVLDLDKLLNNEDSVSMDRLSNIS